MFKQRTVFVIGAGSSCELGLPTGNDLMSRIELALAKSSSSQGYSNDQIVRALIDNIHQSGSNPNSGKLDIYRNKAELVRQAMPFARSIDTYLESQSHDPDIVLLGKLAIAYVILTSEAQSALRLSPTEKQKDQLRDSWYTALSRILTSGQRPASVSDIFANVSFVVFNYDRCLEVFLLRMLRAYFHLNDQDALKALTGADIVHAYGDVGSLYSGSRFIPFGASNNVDLLPVAAEIKTYTEAASEGTISRIQSMIEQADALVFMGFGFLAQNLALLSPPRGSQARQIFATAYGMSEQDRQAIRYKLREGFGEIEQTWSGEKRIDAGRREQYTLRFERGRCSDLMRNNMFSLADQ